jgi:hypothetical protein
MPRNAWGILCVPLHMSNWENRWMSEQEWMWKMRHLSLSLSVTVEREAKNKSHNSFHWRMNSHIIVWRKEFFHDLTHGSMTMLFIESGTKSISLPRKISLAWHRKGISILIQDRRISSFHSAIKNWFRYFFVWESAPTRFDVVFNAIHNNHAKCKKSAQKSNKNCKWASGDCRVN